MYFNSFQPCAMLSDFIRCYWILESDIVQEQPELILPDGCMELVLHYGDKYISDFGEKEQEQPGCILVGQLTEAIKLRPKGRTGILSIRFHPWGFYCLTGIPVSEMRQRFFTATDVLGNEIGYVQEQLYAASMEEKVALVEKYLVQLYINGRDIKRISKTGYFGNIVRDIEYASGNVPVESLASVYNLSVRQFNRSFSEAMGLSPKQYSRIIRLQHFMNRYQPGSETLTQVLHQCGYYDQAHFIREFRDIAGVTPTSFYREDNEMANLMLL